MILTLSTYNVYLNYFETIFYKIRETLEFKLFLYNMLNTSFNIIKK